MSRVTPFPSLALALLAAVPAAGAPRPITLDEAVRLAERNAPVVVQAAGRQRTSKAGVRAAYAAFLPSLSLSAGASRQLPARSGTRVENGQVVTLAPEPWSYNAGLGANVEVFSGGQRFFELGQAKAQAAGAAVDAVSARFDAALAARQQYFAVLAARESEAAAGAQLEQAGLQLETSRLRLRQRVVTRSDSLRAEIQVHNARLAALQARTSLDQANASLTRAVGADEPVTAAEDGAPDAGTLAADDAALRAMALDGPVVRGASATLDAARAAMRGSWARYLPSVTASYSRSGNGTAAAFSLAGDDFDYSGAVRLSLSFPVFQQWQREQQVVQARASLADAEAGMHDARLAALESLTQWLGTYRAAAERVAIQGATLAAAEEDLREQQEKYRIGATTQLEVLASQTTLDQARRDLIQARFDQRVAKARLEALVGRNL